MSKEWYWSRSMKRREREGPGCMSGLLQLFDLHYFSFTTAQQPTSNTDTETVTKGVEAPRNSLELLDGQFKRAASSLSVMEEGKEEEEEEDDIPMGILLVPESVAAATTTTVSKAITKESTLASSSSSNSFNGTKTPNVVARLMGLDLLPDDQLSPSPYRRDSPLKCKSNQFSSLNREFRRPLQSTNINLMENNQMGTRSLPETPRISSARRSDVDPRLSLQLNKENMAMAELHYSSSSPLLSAKATKKEWRDPEENKSPRSHYARELVKQVKERVGRKKVGFDMTNSIDDDKFKRRSEDPSQTKQSTSSSPRIRFIQPKSESMVRSPSQSSPRAEISPPPTKESGVPKSKTLSSSKMMIKQQRPNCNRFTEQIKKPPPSPPSENARSIREKGFVRHLSAAKTTLSDKKCKTPLSKDLNIVVPSSNPVQKKSSSSITKLTTRHVPTASQTYPPTTRHPSITSIQPYDQTNTLDDRDDRTATTSTRNRYIKDILKHTGVESNTSASGSFAKCVHSFDPTTFETLENSTVHVANAGDPLAHRCNRKLTFHLVDEILRQVLDPSPKPWIRPPRPRPTGDVFLRTLCAEMRSLPSAKCETLEDIDALVEKDMRVDANVRCLEEEIEATVFEIERGMMESLIDDVVLCSVR